MPSGATFSTYAQQSDTIRILYASDMPNIGDADEGGYPYLATAVKQLRHNHSMSLFLFGGNSLGPSSMSMFDSGSHIIDLLNSIEPDAMAVTKREFSYYEEELSLRSYEALFPLIATNVEDPSNNGVQNGIAKSALLPVKNLQVGVMAVVDPAAAHEYLLQRVIITDVERSIRAQASTLRSQGADAVVLMVAANYPFIPTLLEEQVIDLALYKTRFNRPAESHEQFVVVQNHGEIALIDLTIEVNGKIQVQYQTQKLSDFQEDAEVAVQRNDYLYRLDRLLNLPITEIQAAFETTRNIVRTEENSFANFVADAMRIYTGADAVVLNSGVIRGDARYEKGQLFTYKDLIKELPYRSSVIKIKLLGRDLLDTLEISLSQYENTKGKFPQVSNIQVQFDPKLPPFSRITSILIAGKPLQLDKTYTIATTDYLFNGGDGFIPLSRGTLIEERGIEHPILSDVVMQRALSEKGITHPISNRLVNLNE